MARASTRTWLSLDRWAEIIGIHPIHFNQLTADGAAATATCGGVWFQHNWQAGDKVSREEVAEKIRLAESMIAQEARYNLVPDWIQGEVVQTGRPYRRDLYGTPYNVRGGVKSVPLTSAHFIAGGRRRAAAIALNEGVVLSDEDGDGFEEQATVVVTDAAAVPCEVRLFYPGQNGDPAWEIRPVKVVESPADTFTITFKAWQIVIEDPQEVLSPTAINGDNSASFLAAVDVYRVYNDPSIQGTLEWSRADGPVCGCGTSSCPVCSFQVQTLCLSGRDFRRGSVAYHPGTWDPDSETFSRLEFLTVRDPDRIRADYYSGWRWPQAAQVGRCDLWDMDPYWESAVAFLAASLLDRPVCDCTNVEQVVDYWRDDLSRSDQARSYQVTPGQLENPFGRTRGGLYAWDRIKQNTRRVV